MIYNMPAVPQDNLKIIVLGAGNVGKSCIVSRFIYGKFLDEYKKTVEDMHHKNYKVNKTLVRLDILDTSGTYAFPAMMDLAISKGDAFILVYSVADESSFEKVKFLRELIVQKKCNDKVPIVVVGNKTDLPDNMRQVKRQLAECIVHLEWGHVHIESSAKLNLYIVDIFREVFKLIKNFAAVKIARNYFKCIFPFKREPF